MRQAFPVVLGIDVFKATFDVAFVYNGQCKHKRFMNQPAGFVALRAWLAKRTSKPIHACIEATGKYRQALAQVLYEQSIVKVWFLRRTKAAGRISHANLIGSYIVIYRTGLFGFCRK